jgi:CheY-like chemotaxis protein
MDGTKLCGRIKQLRPDAKVYAISGHIGLYDDNKLVQFGFDGITNKPISMNTLIETIQIAVGNLDADLPG